MDEKSGATVSEHPDTCHTELVMEDDESHGKDGMPWPDPPETSE